MNTDIPPDVLEFCLDRGLRGERIADFAVLGAFHHDLQDANARTNLTRILSREEFWIKHVADSLAAVRELPELVDGSVRRAADVGCGAGFPLVPLAWAFPSLPLTGIESRKRKADFVALEARRLGLANVRVIPLPAREVARRGLAPEGFDLILARAVGAADRLIRECHALLARGPRACMLFYKTPAGVDREIETARREAGRLGLVVSPGPPFELPRGLGQRQFLAVRRIG